MNNKDSILTACDWIIKFHQKWDTELFDRGLKRLLKRLQTEVEYRETMKGEINEK